MGSFAASLLEPIRVQSPGEIRCTQKPTLAARPEVGGTTKVDLHGRGPCHHDTEIMTIFYFDIAVVCSDCICVVGPRSGTR